MSGYEEAHKPIKVTCPFCERKQEIEEGEVYVLFRRGALCFVDCEKCDQTFSVDKELKRATT